MGNMEGWSLFELSDTVYLLDRNSSGDKGQTESDNLLTRNIGKNERSARRMAYDALTELEEKGIADALEKGRLKRFKGVDYHLYEFHVGQTVWRLFMYKNPDNAFVIVIDVFKGHQGSANKTARDKAASRSEKERFDAARSFAAELGRQ